MAAKIIDFQRWKEKKAIDKIFGEGFVESYVSDYDTITYSYTIEGEDYQVTIDTENLFDPY